MPQTDHLERIAIVGVGGIFPGAPDLDTFWRNIAGAVDCGRDVPPDRWYLSPEKAYAPWPPKPDRVYSTWGCFIEDFCFDPEGLNLDRELLSRLDPMFHLGLHAARAAYRDAHQLAGIDHGRVGVILGNIALPTESTSAICRDILGRTFIEKLIDTAAIAARKSVNSGSRPPSWTIALADPKVVSSLKASLKASHWDPLNRFAAGLPSSLIARGLGLGGIAFTLDAACASSLYSLKFAVEELLSHRADAMLAGGMSRPDCQYTQMGFAQLQALSRRGRCAPLSAEADGLVVGEGAGVFVLKRLSDAVANGDHIYAVIAGIGLSNDRGANLLAPHSEGQLRAMRSAYEQAGWKPNDVDLIECHATGTPVGDAVEISSLHQLWEHESARAQQCVIGGVKSNVGHLLTGAGAAGLMKVLLALKHQTLPPTANFTQPAERLASADSPFRVLSQSEFWPRRTHSTLTPRRATINAFGFGGINAHVLIEEWTDAGAHKPAANQLPGGLGDKEFRVLNSLQVDSSPNPVAIVGLGAHIGNWTNKQEAQYGLFQGRIPDAVELNWWGIEESDWFQREASLTPAGHGIVDVRLPMGQFRIPPLEMQDMLPQQQLMLKVTAEALRDVDAGKTQAANVNGGTPQTSSMQDTAISSQSPPDIDALANTTGVFIAIELDPNTTNFHFRWSIEQDSAQMAEQLGLDLTADQMSDWIKLLKDAAGPPLTPNRVMGNLGGIVASRLAREFDVGGPSFTVSCGDQSQTVAINLAYRALQRGELQRAIVGSIELSTDPRWMIPQDQGDAISIDIAEAAILKRVDHATRDADRIYGVIREYHHIRRPAAPPELSLINGFERLSSFRRFQGHVECLLAPALHVYQQFLCSQWKWNSRYESTGSLPFDVRPRDPAIVHPVGCGVYAFALTGWRILVEQFNDSPNPVSVKERHRPMGELPFGVFAVTGDSVEDLNRKLDHLERLSNSGTSIEQSAIRWFHSNRYHPDQQLILTLVAASADELRSLIAQGRHRIQAPDAQAITVSRRMYFSATPLAPTGRLAFVFPGSGNAFPDMAVTLLSNFPEVLRRQQQENSDLREQLMWAFHQEMVQSSSYVDLMSTDPDHKAKIFAQVGIGAAICDLLALFNVKPTASIGYSLGESAAFFGLRAWTDRDEMLRRMQRSPLFGSDLVSPFAAARKAWNVPDDEDVPWLSGVVDRSASDIRAAIDRMRFEIPADSRVYLLIINTPRQCVIGGDRGQVEQLIRELNATFVPIPSPSTVHCDVLRQVEQAYRELHLMRTTPPVVDTDQGPRPIDFYSAAWGRKYDLSRQSAADAIVAQAVDTIDFPRVIEQAYADGVRIFVEIGPGSSCTKMIDEILGDRPHLARPALPLTSRPVEAFFELLAALIAERVPVDLSYLYGQSPPVMAAQTPPREVVTRVGGLPFTIPSPPGGWRFRSAPTPEPAETTPAPSFADLPAALAPESSDRLPVPSSPGSCTIAAVVESDPPFVIPAETNRSLSLLDQFELMNDQRTQAHETFLRLSGKFEQLAAEQLALLTQAGVVAGSEVSSTQYSVLGTQYAGQFSEPVEPVRVEPQLLNPTIPDEPPTALNRQQCMEFAIGKIGRVLGQKFAEIDSHPTRVRLPDEPLMLVDRILAIEGEPLSMTSGRVITEHDIHANAWYLDCGRIPTCIAVESGQADLFLSGWLGIDFQTRGLACYRLLDAVVTFHDALPGPGKTIHYDIRVLHFFRQGSTYLFRFEFDATVDGRPLLTMREGCAGFFTDAELASGKGIIHTALDKRERPGIRPADWNNPVPMAVESYSDQQLLALRRGDLGACFGPAFTRLPLRKPVTLPGLTGDKQASQRSRMWLIDRVLKLDPVGGKFGMGSILGELDIHPDDWFLTCHFCDDQVMPGTLMYECCLHTLRIFLLRMGWIGEAGEIVYEPIPEIRSRLKCRGQVLASTKKVWYEVTLKEIGYGAVTSDERKRSTGEGNGEPDDGSSCALSSAYCLADALMYADGKPIVEITDMSVRLTGLTRDAVTKLWTKRNVAPVSVTPRYDRRPPIFDTDRITAFAIGKPSVAFGDRYVPFDEQRKIARLPGPPFQFLDRIVSIKDCQPWVLQAGGEIVAQYDVPTDAWYFASNRQPTMPFAVLLETALQPCGWLAAYLGSALTSDIDLSFRNLGGTATQFRHVTSQSGTLTTTVKMTRVSNSAGMIIQHYDFDLRCNGEPVYVGNTYFGFFSKAALSNQIGIREATPYQPDLEEQRAAKRGSFPAAAPFPDDQFRMIQTIECLSPDGGPYGKGCIVGTMPVAPSSWFFKAHFYQDPVVPGSLGLESFWQLLKVFAAYRWKLGSDAQFDTPAISTQATPAKHEWIYRGQVIPQDRLVTVTAVIREIDDQSRTLTGEGFLSVDGRVIYQMKAFTLSAILPR